MMKRFYRKISSMLASGFVVCVCVFFFLCLILLTDFLPDPLRRYKFLHQYALVYMDISFIPAFGLSLLSGAVLELFLVISSLFFYSSYHLFLLWFPRASYEATAVASALSLETRGTFLLSYILYLCRNMNRATILWFTRG